MPDDALPRLIDFLHRHPRLVVITGAGISTASNIPDYRDCEGNWKRRQPVMYQDFMARESVRQRYWGRSLVGWQYFSRAQPNASHRALVRLEEAGKVDLVVTQNVDDLHQRAGQQRLLPLHGTLDKVRCMACGHFELRHPFQQRLIELNPLFAQMRARAAPDGDADLDNIDFSDFKVPRCPQCGGIMKPDAVFYGESVPRERYRQAERRLYRADALLIVGSSLMVYSAFRFAKLAHAIDRPIAAINLGITRADNLLTLKLTRDVESLLPRAAATLA